MSIYKRTGLLVVILLVVIQFVQPNKNLSGSVSDADISNVYPMSPQLHATLQQKCYDCHSNNTRYPWYFNIQPIGWWLAAHVHEGKEELNFSDFRNYPLKKALHKLDEIGEIAEHKSMPLKAYTIFHEDAELTVEDQKAIREWLQEAKLSGSVVVDE